MIVLHRCNLQLGRGFVLLGARVTLWKIVTGVVIGNVLGFAYYRFIGCATGACLMEDILKKFGVGGACGAK